MENNLKKVVRHELKSLAGLYYERINIEQNNIRRNFDEEGKRHAAEVLAGAK